MPEHEIAKHTRAIYKAWGDPHHSWKHKLGEVSIEIGIIVFAITLSLFLERVRERQHEREIEKQFLIGLEADLADDIQQESGDSSSYAAVLPGWRYLRKAGLEKHIVPPDTLNIYMGTILNSTVFIPNDSRFEALKSSGELGVIEDASLQNKILNLYQFKIRTLITATDYFIGMKQNHLLPLLCEKLTFQSNGTHNLNAVLQLPQVQNFLVFGDGSADIMLKYHNVMAQSRDIIHLINLQYGLKNE